ncbi:MAG: FAD-dependent oxidoreductase [Marmoricola sp.]
MTMTSLWLDRALPTADDPLPGDGRADEIVVGAGITGLITAVLLARAGRRVVVLEAEGPGAVTTGRTTAKVSLLQGTKYATMLGLQSAEVVASYVDANREGLEWLRRYCADHDVPAQDRLAATFAGEAGERDAVEREHQAAVSLGLPVTWRDELDVPFPVHGATVLEDQLQLDPGALVAALVAELRSHGGTLSHGRVSGVSLIGAPHVSLQDGTTVRGEHVVVATGTPIIDRALHFAKVEPQRSYLLAYTGAGAPEPMAISAGRSKRSVRGVPAGGPLTEPVLLVGGAGHGVGRTRSEAAHVEDLRAWAATYYPGAVETHAWSAQDYSPYSGLPMVGPVLPGSAVYVATGYDKWGMATGAAAGRTLSAEILGGQGEAISRWTSPWRPSTRSVGRAARMNGAVGLQLAEGVARVVRGGRTSDGEGVVRRDGIAPVAVPPAGVDGCPLVATCTHLGGIVRWNDAEQSWDCPLHGSRFAPDGSVLEGPATSPLLPDTD